MQKKNWIAILSVLAVANILLFNPINLYFLNDDFLHIPLTDKGELFQLQSVRPMHELLIKLELFIWGNNATGFHITALLLYFIVAFELFFLTKIISGKILKQDDSSSLQISFLAVSLFLVYPQNTEALAWVLGRGTMLSTAFLLPVIILFLKKKKSITTVIIGSILFALAIFSYEQCALLVVLLGILYWQENEGSEKKKKFEFLISILGVTFIYIVARKIISTEVIRYYEGRNFSEFNFKILFNNIYRLFFRLFLNPSIQPKYFFIATAVFTPLLGFTIWISRNEIKKSYVPLLFLAIILFIIPVISLGITVRSYESGRYMLLPSIFLLITVAYFLSKINNKKTALALSLGLFIYWGYGKIQSASHFKDASFYSKKIQEKAGLHYANSTNDSLYFDTLHVTIHRLPVYRMGLKTGILWLNPKADTTKIKIGYIFDEFVENP